MSADFGDEERITVTARHERDDQIIVLGPEEMSQLRTQIDFDHMFNYGVRAFTMYDGWSYELQEII